MLDIEPATRALSGIVARVGDDQLDLPTPCAGSTVGDLLDHVSGFAQAFTRAAAKSNAASAGRPAPDAAKLGDDWRTRIPASLDALAQAWRDPAAWEGMTRAGGLDMPGEICGVVALDEAILHGWDIAVATGQPYDCPADLLEVAYRFVHGTAERNPNGTPGLFGARVPVPDDAPLLHRLLGESGRRPDWASAGS